jgi:hypothetical protein
MTTPKVPVIPSIRSFRDVESALNNFRSYLVQMGIILDKATADETYATTLMGVTNGDDHDHDGGDGAQISHSSLSGLTTGDPHTQYQKESEKGQASGYASLSAGILVVENPASATATPAASKIPIADGSGDLDAGWVPEQLGSHKFGSASHHTQFEADGTMKAVGDATVWKDIFFPMAPPKTTGAGNPTLVAWNTPLRGYSFAVNDTHDFDPQEFSHDGKVGSTATFHIHWISRTDVAAERTVKWQIELAQANYGDAFPAPTTESIEIAVPADTPANTHFITDITTFTTLGIASQMFVKLTRIASSGTEPADDPVVIGVHYHYELDTMGSRQILTK